MMNMEINQEQKTKASIEFLLSEYKTIAENRLQEIERGQNYVNLYLTITSGAAALLTLMSQIAARSFRITSLVILLNLLLLGIISFIRVIQRDIRITSHARRMSRIRFYFVKIDPSIVPYLPYSQFDDKPYKHKGLERIGLRSIVELIDSVLVATIIYIANYPTFQLWFSLLVVLFGFGLSVLFHELFANMRSNEAENRMEIRFSAKSEQKRSKK